MKVKFWGVRGSIPTPGIHTTNIGGNTSCVTVEGDMFTNRFIVLDGGTGIREFGIDILRHHQFFNGNQVFLNFDIFFSHIHWDHIQGIPFFKPMFLKNNSVTMFGERRFQASLEETLKGQQHYPNFPISLEEVAAMGASMSYKDMVSGDEIYTDDNITVSCVKLNHPDGVLCYKVEDFTLEVENPNAVKKSKKVVYATDTEHYSVLDKRLLKIAKDADVLIYDAQYTPEEYSGEKDGMQKIGWGHSTYVWAVDTAVEAGVKHLVLFHHDPEHTDSDIVNIEKEAIKHFQSIQGNSPDLKITAACEGLELNL